MSAEPFVIHVAGLVGWHHALFVDDYDPDAHQLDVDPKLKLIANDPGEIVVEGLENGNHVVAVRVGDDTTALVITTADTVPEE